MNDLVVGQHVILCDGLRINVLNTDVCIGETEDGQQVLFTADEII